MKDRLCQTLCLPTLVSLSFFFGFFSYLGIEKLYKHKFSHSATHWSMGLIAGLSFLFLLALDQKKIPLPLKAVMGGTFITLFELLFGMILNLHYHLNVWDYHRHRGHLKGQICPLFSSIWCLASFAVIALNRLFSHFVFQAFGKKTPIHR